MSLRKTLVLTSGILLTSLIIPRPNNLENLLVQDTSAQTILVPGSYSNINVSTPEKAFDAMIFSTEKKDVNLFSKIAYGQILKPGQTTISGPHKKSYSEWMKQVSSSNLKLRNIVRLSENLACLEVDSVPLKYNESVDMVFAEKQINNCWRIILTKEKSGDVEGKIDNFYRKVISEVVGNTLIAFQEREGRSVILENGYARKEDQEKAWDLFDKSVFDKFTSMGFSKKFAETLTTRNKPFNPYAFMRFQFEFYLYVQLNYMNPAKL